MFQYSLSVVVLALKNHIGRYTDFLVNEILPSGQVVHLDNLKIPARKQQEKNTKTETPSSAPGGDLNVTHSGAPEPVPELVPEYASVPAPEPIPEPLPEPLPEHLPEPTGNAGTASKDSEFASSTANWQAYASEPSAIQVRHPHLA